jgi:hypothetical protein
MEAQPMALIDLGEALHVAESPGPGDSSEKHLYRKRDALWLVAAVMWVSRSLELIGAPGNEQMYVGGQRLGDNQVISFNHSDVYHRKHVGVYLE